MKTGREKQELAMAASKLTRQDLTWIENNTQDLSSQEVNTQETSSQETSSQEESSQDNNNPDPDIFTGNNPDPAPEPDPATASKSGKPRKRRSVKHTWPEVGTVLQANYEGVHYEAEVIASPKYKSGKAVKILSGPAAGKVKSSMSGAMNLATKRQREDNNLGSKGVSNGWEFWKPRK